MIDGMVEPSPATELLCTRVAPGTGNVKDLPHNW